MKREDAGHMPAATEIVARFAREGLAHHPLFVRLGSEPVDLRRVYLLLANGQAGIVRDFARRLASVTARIGDERIRSMLAKQLNDELGNGDYARAHSLLYEQFLGGLAEFRPASISEEQLGPGRELGRRLEAIYADPEPYVGVGASLVMEVYGKQVDHRVGQEIRRHKTLNPESLTWLVLHEELEVDHVEESMQIARLVPEAGAPLEAAWRGATAVADAARDFFDGMERVCFG